jgi:hypothetical protein
MVIVVEGKNNTRREIYQLLAALAIGKIIVLLAVFLYNPTPDFLETMSTDWDSQIFQSIAIGGYEHVKYYAFSPVYPVLIRVLEFIIPSVWVSGLIITNILSFIFPLVLRKAFGLKTAFITILFPTYLVFTTIPYSDVIVLVFLALSLLFIMREKLMASSAMLSLAVISVFRAAIILPAYAFEVLKTRRLKNLVFFIAPAVAGGLILLWFQLGTGDFMAYFSIQGSYWDVHSATPVGQVKWLMEGWFTAQTWAVAGIELTPLYWLLRNLIFEVFYLVG